MVCLEPWTINLEILGFMPGNIDCVISGLQFSTIDQSIVGLKPGALD